MRADFDYWCNMMHFNGFTRMDNVFYRWQDDGIGCIVHFETVREKETLSFILEFALESFYSELPIRPYSSMDCCTRYPVINFLTKQAATIIRPTLAFYDRGIHKWYNKSFSPREQLDVMKEYLFPFLDSIQTQEQLVQAMTEMEILRDGHEDPLSIEKYAPLLYSQRYQEAGTIIKNWLNEMGVPEEAWRSNTAMEEYARISFNIFENKFDGLDKQLLFKSAQIRMQRLQHLQFLLQLAENADDRGALSYLKNNYKKNMEYISFIEGNH